jgi:hypothetical protein
MAVLPGLPAPAADDPRPADGSNAGDTIAITADRSRVEIAGLPEAALVDLAPWPPDDKRWSQIFVLFVDAQGADAQRPVRLPVLGKYTVDCGAIAFTPRFPLRPGLAYRAALNTDGLAGASPALPARVEQTLVIPALPPAPPTEVTAAYPSGDELPENLLKFYVHFSAPMAPGDDYRHVRIIDESGAEVPHAFLALPEELWSADRRRLTLLFDPGRIKRGLKPHEEVGSPLLEGRRYALVIDAGWRDARGNPLAAPFRREFGVAAPDAEQPDPHRWALALPRAGGRDALEVAFNEPLDQAMLQHALEVRDAEGRAVDGRVAVDREETRWRFEPAQAWQAGDYTLVVDADLEDRAGNSVGRPYEVFNRSGPVGASSTHRPVDLPFKIEGTR